MSASSETLLCFAVKQEAQPFIRLCTAGNVRTLVTGMGPANAQRAVESELARVQPRLVISAGFAGGLAPELPTGTVLVCSADAQLNRLCQAAGAKPGRFHCAPRVATTVREKCALREQTGADAVDMESGIIGTLCDKQGITYGAVRVILDSAGEDLPLDFNALMNSEQALAPTKLALALGRRPWKVPALLRLQRRLAAAALALARILVQVVG